MTEETRLEDGTHKLIYDMIYDKMYKLITEFMHVGQNYREQPKSKENK